MQRLNLWPLPSQKHSFMDSPYLLFSHSIHPDVQRNGTILFCGFDIFPVQKKTDIPSDFSNSRNDPNSWNVFVFIEFIPTSTNTYLPRLVNIIGERPLTANEQKTDIPSDFSNSRNDSTSWNVFVFIVFDEFFWWIF